MSAVAEPVDVCEAWEVEPGTACRAVVQGHAIAIFNVEGIFHATDDTCTHGFASLAEGALDGHVVTCPWHGGAFDVRSGRAVALPCTASLGVHPCELRDGIVRVRLKTDQETEDAHTR